MDIVLNLCDDYFLDKVWSALVPLSAFTDQSSEPFYSLNSSLPAKLSLPSSLGSSWSHLISVSGLPHPKTPLLNSTASYQFPDASSLSAWPRDYFPRQLLSLLVLTLIGIHLLYFIFAGASYYLIFNHDMMRHPRFLKNQVRLEIQSSLRAFPWMTLLTLPWFQAEVMGYGRLYDDVNEYGWGYFVFSIFWYVFPSFTSVRECVLIALQRFLIFTDFCIYWVHRWLHIPWIYKRLHKPHHKWIGTYGVFSSLLVHFPHMQTFSHVIFCPSIIF